MIRSSCRGRCLVSRVAPLLRLAPQMVPDLGACDLEPMEVDRLRLFIHRTEDGAPGWSIPEIHLFEPMGATASARLTDTH